MANYEFSVTFVLSVNRVVIGSIPGEKVPNIRSCLENAESINTPVHLLALQAGGYHGFSGFLWGEATAVFLLQKNAVPST